jgi:hypothetical protein
MTFDKLCLALFQKNLKWNSQHNQIVFGTLASTFPSPGENGTKERSFKHNEKSQ